MSNSHYIASFDRNALSTIYGEPEQWLCAITGKGSNFALQCHHIFTRRPTEVLRKEIEVKKRRKFYGSPLNCIILWEREHDLPDVHSEEKRYLYLQKAYQAVSNSSYFLKPNDYQFIEEMRIWFDLKGLADIYHNEL